MHAEFSEKMDAVLSSSCFQWIPDLRGLFGKISRVSSDGAVLAFSTFGAKNYPQIRSLVGGGLEYRTPYEIRDALAAAGYSVLYCAEDILDAFFPTPKDVLRHIKSTGVNGRFSRFWDAEKIRRILEGVHRQFFGRQRRRPDIQPDLHHSGKMKFFVSGTDTNHRKDGGDRAGSPADTPNAG